MHKKGSPKTGGRQKGTPNRVTVEAREAAGALVDDPIYRRTLARDMRARTVQPAIESLLWHYAKGKPKDVVEITGSLDVAARAAQIAEDVRNMTDEELAEYDALERQQEALLARAHARHQAPALPAYLAGQRPAPELPDRVDSPVTIERRDG
jgi:uncharacterized protein YdeI (BOF family)